MATGGFRLGGASRLQNVYEEIKTIQAKRSVRLVKRETKVIPSKLTLNLNPAGRAPGRLRQTTAASSL